LRDRLNNSPEEYPLDHLLWIGYTIGVNWYTTMSGAHRARGNGRFQVHRIAN